MVCWTLALFARIGFDGWVALVCVAAGLLVALAICTVMAARSRRSAGLRIVVYLESATRMGLPLAEMIESAAAMEDRRFAASLRKLADLLRAGRSVRDALALAAPQVTIRIRELIGVAERTGRLSETLAELLEQAQREKLSHDPPVQWLYPLLVLGVLCAILAAALVWAPPAFAELYSDSEADRTDMAGAILHESQVFVALLALAAGMLVPLGIVTLWAAAVFYRDSGLPSPPALAAIGEGLRTMAGRLPLAGPALRDRQLADACSVIASALRSAIPLQAALLEAQTLPIDPSLRRRIVRWVDGLESGQSPEQAARAAGMPRLLVGMLATGQAAAGPAEAFDFLSRYYAARFSRALELARGALVPAAVLLLGLLTGAMVLALLSPMFTLIETTARNFP